MSMLIIDTCMFYLLVREQLTNSAEEQLSHLTDKYNMIIEDGLLYMADGVVVFDPNVRRFRYYFVY